jgi:dCMP deaminase
MKVSHPNNWDIRFFQLCNLLASWSEDRGRRVGAVVVGPGNEIRTTGYNGFPRGVNARVDNRHSKENGEKYLWFEHAERNAIYNAARFGASLEGCRIYCSLFPCAECVRAVIQSGINELNTHLPPKNDPVFNRSFEVSIEMLQEAGVGVRLFERIA